MAGISPWSLNRRLAGSNGGETASVIGYPVVSGNGGVFESHVKGYLAG
jgi:hypothetical protein